MNHISRVLEGILPASVRLDVDEQASMGMFLKPRLRGDGRGITVPIAARSGCIMCLITKIYLYQC